jgi:biotin synthase
VKADAQVQRILEKAQSGKALNREDCLYLFKVEETSLDSGLIRSAASSIRREKTGNSGVLLGQIGVETAPCPGGCRFCAFGEEHTSFARHRMDEAELNKKIDEFCDAGDLYGLYLMAMHDYDWDYYLETVYRARRRAPVATQIWVNVGDTGRDMFTELRKAGASGVHHVCRLREGTDTKLDPQSRRETMRNALDAGLQLYTCLEPVGPEHSAGELTENLFIGLDMGVFQHAAMRRVAVPGSPLYRYGQISELRLAHLVAVAALAASGIPSMSYMGVHEPMTLGLTSGAEVITAETGANPRDIQGDTSEGRGMDIRRCRRMLYECGFTRLRRGDETAIPLDFAYLEKTDSI